MNVKYLELFWYWIREREIIRVKKELGEPRPWSEDAVLNTYHFCNVRREDDRGTKEIRFVVQQHIKNLEDLPWAYTLARMLNYAPSVNHALGAMADGLDWVTRLKINKELGAKVFHPAYVVSTCGQAVDKLDYVAGTVRAVKKLKVPRIGLQAAHSTLMQVNGLGSFLAAQVVADLRNDRYLGPMTPPESTRWSAWGPGSKKGLDIIFEGGTTPGNYQSRMEWLMDWMPLDIKAMYIHAQDLQNCLCEFSKYIRHHDKMKGRVRYYQ